MEKRNYTQPIKFHKFFEAMKSVLADVETVVLTDTELHIMVNQKLDYADRVSYSTFEKWKSPTGSKSVEAIEGISAEEADEFRQCLAYARVNQKIELSKRILDPKNNNSYAEQWIMERKFQDMKASPQIQLNSNPTIQIEASNKEHAALIDSIINGETLDVDHEEVDNKKRIK